MRKSIKKSCLLAASVLAIAAPIMAAVSAMDQYATQTDTSSSVALTVASVIKQGSRGSDVKEMQRRLKEWG